MEVLCDVTKYHANMSNLASSVSLIRNIKQLSYNAPITPEKDLGRICHILPGPENPNKLSEAGDPSLSPGPQKAPNFF